MKKASGVLLILLGLSATQVEANDKIRISGFGSIVGGIVIDGDGYWARLPEGAGQYSDGIELQSESKVAIQARYTATDKLSVTGQVLVRGVNDFEPNLEWLYATYDITSDTNIKAGQMRLPVYHFSDYMDVGLTYPWLRVPSDAYSLALTNYQGISIDMNFDFDEVTSHLKLYTGKKSTDPNKLITLIDQYKGEQLYDDSDNFSGLRGIRTTKDYKDMVGVVLDSNYDALTLRLSYLQGRENFTSYAERQYPSNPAYGGEWVDTEFLDISLQYDQDEVLAMVEWNDYDNIYTSWFVSFAYRLDEHWTPYIFYSQFTGDLRFIAPGGISSGFEDAETGSLDDDYNSIGLGARYNLTPYTALKFELLQFTDDGDAAVYIDENQDGKTDSTAFFVSLDFIF